MDTKIFVMTHKKVDEVEDGLHYLMQVGKAGKEDYGYFGDDTGDNISLKNQTYCELFLPYSVSLPQNLYQNPLYDAD